MSAQLTQKNQKHLMVMAAGTGGHIFPGIAIAAEMQQRGWTVSWLGTRTGMEVEIVSKHPIPMDLLDFTGLRGKGWKHSLSGAWKLMASFVRCISIVRQRRPDVVLGMGGYVTVPGGVMSALMGKPLVLMNADAPLLLSNKALKWFAKKLMFGLPSSASTQDAKSVLTGNPIREAIANLPPPAQRYAQRQGPLRVLVVGGSLGAQVLNQTLPRALAQIAPERRPVVTHQSGKQHIDALRVLYADMQVDAEVLDFIEDMPRRYAEADVVICRSGAITVSELTAAGVASVLLPFVASSTSHQKANAMWLNQAGAGIYLPQNELTPERMAELLLSLRREDCLHMANIAYGLGRRQANAEIARIIEELAQA